MEIWFPDDHYHPAFYPGTRFSCSNDESNKTLLVNSLDLIYGHIIHNIAKNYYDRDLPASELFTYDANPYGSLDDLYLSKTVLPDKVKKVVSDLQANYEAIRAWQS